MVNVPSAFKKSSPFFASRPLGVQFFLAADLLHHKFAGKNLAAEEISMGLLKSNWEILKA